MSLETQELRKIFTEIQAEFFNNRKIHVHPVSGDPPSQYEVTYDIPCTTQDEQGNITISSRHIITIAIPFGFPHFPPSCKPKSPIFHPDFDSVAISLGDFWNRERTIPELIRYIAKMLRGEVYSLENTFNEEAATWFRQNSSKLPFDKENEGNAALPALSTTEPQEEGITVDEVLELSDLELSPEVEELPEAVQLEPAEESEPLILSLEPSEEDDKKLSTMDDLDFMDDFNFSEEIPEVSSAPQHISDAVQAKIDSDRLRHLARKRNFSKLEKELAAIPQQSDFPGRQELAEKTTYTLKEAGSLYSEAESYENQGLANKALECFRAVENLVADYPNIKADISRTQNAMEMLKEITPSSAATQQEKDKPQQKSKKKSSPSAPAPESIADAKVPRREKRARRPVKFILYAMAGGVACVLGAVAYYYFTLNNSLAEARQRYAECTSSFAAKDFQSAKKSCTDSLALTQNIYLIHHADVTELRKGIRKILDSEEMQEGLQGMVLFNNKYIAKTVLSAHQSLQEMLGQGKGFLESSSWDQAAASFVKALELSKQIADYSPDERMNIEQNLNYADFRAKLTVAERLVDQEAWQQATDALTSLQGQIDKLSPQQQAEYHDYVETLLAKSRFTTLKAKADILFAQSDWEGAASLFQKAVEAGRSLSEKENQDLAGIKANISRAELYATINAGNSAFAQGHWDAAIDQYTKASGIINTNSELLGSQEAGQGRKKLERIILQSTIIRDRQLSEKSRKQGDLTGASAKLQKVTEAIQKSRFVNDPEFKDIFAKTVHAQQEIQDAIFVKKKEQYLLDHYAKLFMDNYPAATQETLTTPLATFEKRLGRLYLFKLQCTETGHGRPLTLIMYYSYDPDSDHWKFYNQN